MSFRPRLPKVPRATPSYTPSPGPQLPHHRQKNLRHRPLVYLSDGRTLAQSVLPPLPGQVGFTGDRPQDGSPRPRPGPDHIPDVSDTPRDYGPIYFDHSDPDTLQDTRHARKRQNQTTRWQQTIIPLLVPIYMQLVAKTDNLRDLHTVSEQPSPPCSCAVHVLAQRGKVKQLKVTLLRWDRLDEISLHICPCSLAAAQLLRRGFFPCAPMEPSVAIELRVLEFVMGLFLNMPPNNTALTKTLESHLDSMGYKLENRDALRRRFGNALEWYTSMRHATTEKIDSIISQAWDLLPQNSPAVPETPPARAVRRPSTPPTPPAPFTPLPSSPLKRRRSWSAATPPPDSSPPSSPTKRARASSPPAPPSPTADPAYPFPELEDRTRPSDYLRARCPACFGGKWEDPTIILGAILSGDACFTQRRNKGKGRKDPPHQHPATVFVPEDVTKTMETFVDSVRPPHKPPGKAKKSAAPRPVDDDEEEDHFEDPKLPVPKSILDECEASFAAADEKRVKSSTQFFDDTGLMGINCRHDHLLFLVNMKTAGEKQFNMYALIEMVLRHLPRKFVVGFLYDIACDLERSARKWGFLPAEYLERLHFAVSVLHAFGHHWGCQLKYHPRRRTLFGLSDGEGCERFWHSISKLIAYLRVCGFYRRLYTLDSQIHHLQHASIRRLGAWLARRWAHCQEKRREAEEVLRDCKQPMTVLRAEYKKQVEAQTKPLPKRAKNSGKLAIEEVVRLRKAHDILKERVKALEDMIVDGMGDAADIEIVAEDLKLARERCRKHQATLRLKEGALGVDETRTLRHLAKSPYIQARMSARTLKYRLREKLRSRQFELDRVMGAYHSKKAEKKPDPKLTTHIENAVKRRDPSIQDLARKYNRLCVDMASLIKQNRAPRNAVAPEQIDPKSVWGLDVDDDIWQDVGLDDAYDEQEPPLWLKSDEVRKGIKGMLELDRCTEEEPRLFHECRALRYWLSEEWEAVSSAVAAAQEQNNAGVVCQLKLRLKELCQLCATWRAAIRPIPFKTDGLPAWGPSDEELLAVRVEDVVASTGSKARQYDDETENEDDDDFFSDEEDEEVLPIEEIEAFQERGEVYREEAVYYEASGDSREPWGTFTDDENWFAQ